MADANANPDPQWAKSNGIAFVPLAEPSVDTDPNLRRLLSRRPGYAKDVEEWALASASWYGGRDWFTEGNLPPHLLEMETQATGGPKFTDKFVQIPGLSAKSAGASDYRLRDEYEMRKAQGFRFNVVRETIEPVANLLRCHPSDDDLPPVDGLEDFWNEADLSRSASLQELGDDATEMAAVFGIYYIATDSSLTPEELRLALEGANVQPNADGLVPSTVIPAARPYAWLIDPTCVLDGYHDDEGKFVEVLVGEQQHNGLPLGVEGSGFKTVYRHWTNESWTLWEIRKKGDGQGKGTGAGAFEAVKLDEGPNNLGHIPIHAVVIWKRHGNPWRGRALADDTVGVDRALAGLGSTLFFSQENEADSQVIGSADLSEFTDPNDPNLAMFMAQVRDTLHSRVGALHRDIKPQVLKKGTGGKEIMLDTYERFLRMTMRLSGLSDKVDDPSNESGIARLRRLQHLGATLGAMAQAKTRALRDVLHSAVLLMGGPEDAIGRETLIAPVKFDVKSISDRMLLWKEMSGRVPPEWEKELLWDVYVGANGEKSEDELKQRRAELDGWPLESAESIIDDAAAEAGAGGTVNAEVAALNSGGA